MDLFKSELTLEYPVLLDVVKCTTVKYVNYFDVVFLWKDQVQITFVYVGQFLVKQRDRASNRTILNVILLTIFNFNSTRAFVIKHPSNKQAQRYFDSFTVKGLFLFLIFYT